MLMGIPQLFALHEDYESTYTFYDTSYVFTLGI
jgi:hypothetical protein